MGNENGSSEVCACNQSKKINEKRKTKITHIQERAGKEGFYKWYSVLILV